MRLTKNISTDVRRFKQLPDNVLLKNVRLIDPAGNMDEIGDLLIEKGRIVSLKQNAGAKSEEIWDLKGKIVTPGWMDMHVHLREPGREDEETISSGMHAAANGGFTAVCCMPDTQPVADSHEIIQYIIDRARDALVNVYPIAAVTKNCEGKELSEILELHEEGAVAISDDHHTIENPEVMRRALEYCKMIDIPVIGIGDVPAMTANGQMNEGFISTCLGLPGMPSVAEELQVARDILLTEYTGSKYHLAHISTAGSVKLVRDAKSRGVRITAGVTPHHLTLTDEAVRSFDTNTKLKPPLRSEADRQALLAGLKDHTIDIIATNHSPHSWEEKAAEYIYAPFGLAGLETAMALCYEQLITSKILDIGQLVEKFAVNPYQILNLPQPRIVEGAEANLTIFDPDQEWTFEERNSLSRSHNSLFLGRPFLGKPYGVVNKGLYFLSVL